MANNTLTKSLNAEGTIGANLLVKPGAADGGALVAAAATDKVIGITTEISVVALERVDVVLDGIADLKLGGTVTRGDLIMSDASGQGILAAAAGGSNVRIIGYVLVSGVSGDIAPVMIAPGSFQG